MNRSCNSSKRSMLSVLMSIVLAAVLALPASVLAEGFTAPASVFADTDSLDGSMLLIHLGMRT